MTQAFGTPRKPAPLHSTASVTVGNETRPPSRPGLREPSQVDNCYRDPSNRDEVSSDRCPGCIDDWPKRSSIRPGRDLVDAHLGLLGGGVGAGAPGVGDRLAGAIRVPGRPSGSKPGRQTGTSCAFPGTHRFRGDPGRGLTRRRRRRPFGIRMGGRGREIAGPGPAGVGPPMVPIPRRAGGRVRPGKVVPASSSSGAGPGSRRGWSR